jgi:hypothetical protein
LLEEIVSGLPVLPMGSCSSQTLRSKFPPGWQEGLRERSKMVAGVVGAATLMAAKVSAERAIRCIVHGFVRKEENIYKGREASNVREVD